MTKHDFVEASLKLFGVYLFYSNIETIIQMASMPSFMNAGSGLSVSFGSFGHYIPKAAHITPLSGIIIGTILIIFGKQIGSFVAGKQGN